MHTPGPWKVSRTKTGYMDIEGGRSGKTWIARVISNNATAGSVQANARLIARAPEVETLGRELAEAVGEFGKEEEWTTEVLDKHLPIIFELADRLRAVLEGRRE